MRSQNLISLNDPHSVAAECYKMLRTNLSYMNIDRENKVILFTSSASEEGKTTSICNTAISFAMGGKKVLLVECDLRKAMIHDTFDVPQSPGLTNILAEKRPLSQIRVGIEDVPNLHIVTSGALPPDPVEALSSHAMADLIAQARDAYDVVLIDAPPILAVTDASVLCRYIDGVVLVVASGETKKDDARKAKKSLEKVGAKILGVLMTKVELSRNSHYYYYGNKSK